MLLLLGVIFAGMSRTMLAMAHGEAATKHPAEPFLAVAPPVVLAALVLIRAEQIGATKRAKGVQSTSNYQSDALAEIKRVAAGLAGHIRP